MSHPRWVHSYRRSVVAGAVGVMLVTSKLVAQTTLPGIIESNLVTVVVGIGILWVGWWRIGRLEKDLAETLAAKTEEHKLFLRLDRFEDHRATMTEKFEAVLERLEGLHKSIQAIRRAQLVRFEERPLDEGGV